MASLLLMHGCRTSVLDGSQGVTAAGVAAFGRTPTRMNHSVAAFVKMNTFPLQSAPLFTSFSTKGSIHSTISVACHCAQPQCDQELTEKSQHLSIFLQ
jgi:hypothetical protein